MNVRPKAIKLLEETIGGKPLDISLSDEVLDLTPKAMVTKAKINKWDYIKLKSFCTAKRTINKMKRQSTEWEKIFANHVSYKELISRILNSQNSIVKKQTIQLEHGQKYEETFHQRRHT